MSKTRRVAGLFIVLELLCLIFNRGYAEIWTLTAKRCFDFFPEISDNIVYQKEFGIFC